MKKYLLGLLFLLIPSLSYAQLGGGIGAAGSKVITGITAKNINVQGSQSSAVACDFSIANVCTATLTGNVTLTVSNPSAGATYDIVLTQDSTGGRTVTLAGGTFKTPTGGTITTAALWNLGASTISPVSFYYDGTNYNLVSAPNAATIFSNTAGLNAQGSQASAVACNLALSSVCTWTATGNVTVTVTNPITGGIYTFIQTQDGTGGRTSTFSGLTLKTLGGQVAGTLLFNQVASAVSAVTCQYDGTNCYIISPSDSAERTLSISGTLGAMGSTAAATLLVQCDVANSSGHFTNLVCTDDFQTACTTAPSFNIRDDTASTTGTAVACSNSAGQVTQAESLVFAAGDRICLVRTVNGGTCTVPTFGVTAHEVMP